MFSWNLDDEIALLFLQPDMASELFRLISDNRDYLSQWLPWLPSVLRPADCAAFIRQEIERFAKGEGLTAGIEYRGEWVGCISYNTIDTTLGKVSIGYWLAECWQGNGIMTRSCQALIHHAFEEMDMALIEIRVATDNEPSKGVCERLAMEQGGRIRRAEKIGQQIVDHISYTLSREQWLAQRYR